MTYIVEQNNLMNSEFINILTDILPKNSEIASFVTGNYRSSDIPYSGYFMIDLRMPKAEAALILAKIKRTPMLNDIPIVILTLS
ncbi:MAG: hypothetical protein ACFFDT_09890, partial [Candidatus Hodarchaeota archaeon]